MNCLCCKNIVLEPRELEQGLLVAGCPNCEGTLITLMNYRYWMDKNGDATVRELHDASDISMDVPVVVASARSCPKCSRLMTKYQIGATTDHQLDLCGSCDEAWLDKGEWQLLKALDLYGKLPKIFTDAWQRNIRKARQEASLQERYEKLIGVDDFAKAKEFKSWVYKHPHKEAIKQFLVIAPE
jgi:Zn-finger nucleic acid-binding protein